MHFTGTIWRPPYEAGSLLLEATAGCTHHRCKFCALYADLPFRFRATPLEVIERDLIEVQTALHSPAALASERLFGERPRQIGRVFLTGANPFALSAARLLEIAALIRRHLPAVRSIGCFARVTDSMNKTDADLLALRKAGFDALTIGAETGDRTALAFMRKGYAPEDIVEQCDRLDRAGISYGFFYLAGICGAGKGIAGAEASARVFNRLRPFLVGANMLTVFKGTALHEEMEGGRWREAGEREKYAELRALVAALDIPTEFAALGASNAVPLQGRLPADRESLLSALDRILGLTEEDLRRYREGVRHL